MLWISFFLSFLISTVLDASFLCSWICLLHFECPASSKSKQQGSNTRATGPTKHTLKDGDLNLDALATFDKEEKPAWIKDRESLYDDIKARQMELWASKNKVDVKVTLPDGKVLDAVAWETTPYGM